MFASSNRFQNFLEVSALPASQALSLHQLPPLRLRQQVETHLAVVAMLQVAPPASYCLPASPHPGDVSLTTQGTAGRLALIGRADQELDFLRNDWSAQMLSVGAAALRETAWLQTLWMELVSENERQLRR